MILEVGLDLELTGTNDKEFVDGWVKRKAVNVVWGHTLKTSDQKMTFLDTPVFNIVSMEETPPRSRTSGSYRA